MKSRLFLCIVLFMSFYVKSIAQERMITGKVNDIKGSPLAGVNVTVQGYPSLTTISGVDGEFRIHVFDFSKALIFSFTKMKNKVVLIGEQDRITVVMEFLPMSNPDPWSFLFIIQSGQTHVHSKAKDNDSQWEYHGEPGIMSSIEVEYFMTQNIGFGTGVGFSAYNSSSFLNSFDNYGSNTIQKVDQDLDTFYLYNTVDRLEERVKVRSIHFPVKVKFRFRPGQKWSFFGELGMKLISVFAAKVKADGRSTWQAYYPKYHVVINNVPSYEYQNYDINEENSMKGYNKFMSSFTASLGMSYRIKKELNLDFGFFLEQGLSDLKYNEPVHPADYLLTAGILDKTVLKGFGFTLGLRYHLTKKR